MADQARRQAAVAAMADPLAQLGDLAKAHANVLGGPLSKLSGTVPAPSLASGDGNALSVGRQAPTASQPAPLGGESVASPDASSIMATAPASDGSLTEQADVPPPLPDSTGAAAASQRGSLLAGLGRTLAATFKGIGNPFAAAKSAYDAATSLPGLKQVRQVGDYSSAKTKAMYQALEGRYGRKPAIAIMASAQVLGWGALGVGALIGVPLYLPGVSLWGSLPAAGLAETVLQGKRVVGKARKAVGFAEGGVVGQDHAEPKAEDTEPAMLAKGEVVVPKARVDAVLTSRARSENAGIGGLPAIPSALPSPAAATLIPALLSYQGQAKEREGAKSLRLSPAFQGAATKYIKRRIGAVEEDAPPPLSDNQRSTLEGVFFERYLGRHLGQHNPGAGLDFPTANIGALARITGKSLGDLGGVGGVEAKRTASGRTLSETVRKSAINPAGFAEGGVAGEDHAAPKAEDTEPAMLGKGDVVLPADYASKAPTATIPQPKRKARRRRFQVPIQSFPDLRMPDLTADVTSRARSDNAGIGGLPTLPNPATGHLGSGEKAGLPPPIAAGNDVRAPSRAEVPSPVAGPVPAPISPSSTGQVPLPAMATTTIPPLPLPTVPTPADLLPAGLPADYASQAPTTTLPRPTTATRPTQAQRAGFPSVSFPRLPNVTRSVDRAESAERPERPTADRATPSPRPRRGLGEMAPLPMPAFPDLLGGRGDFGRDQGERGGSSPDQRKVPDLLGTIADAVTSRARSDNAEEVPSGGRGEREGRGGRQGPSKPQSLADVLRGLPDLNGSLGALPSVSPKLSEIVASGPSTASPFAGPKGGGQGGQGGGVVAPSTSGVFGPLGATIGNLGTSLSGAFTVALGPLQALTAAVGRFKDGLATSVEGLKTLGATGASVFSSIYGSAQKNVGLFDPTTARLFTMELQDLGAAFGSLLVPVLKTATDALRQVNEWITGLSPTTKKLVGVLATAAAGAGLFASVLPRLLSVGTTVFSGLGAAVMLFTGKMTLLNVMTGGILPILGLLATALIGAGVAGAVLGEKAGPLASIFEALKGAVAIVGDSLKEAFETARPAIAAIGSELASALVPLAQAISPAIQGLMPVFGMAVQGAALLSSLLAPAIANLGPSLQALVPIITILARGLIFLAQINPFMFLLKGFADFQGAFSGTFKPVLESMTTLFKSLAFAQGELFKMLIDLVKELGNAFGGLLSSIQPVISTLMDGLIAALKEVIELTTRAVVTLTVLAKRLKDAKAEGGEGGLFSGVPGAGLARRLGSAINPGNVSGISEEIEAKLRELRGGGPEKDKDKAGPKNKTYAARDVVGQSIEEASKKLQIAGLSASKIDPGAEAKKHREEAAAAAAEAAEAAADLEEKIDKIIEALGNLPLVGEAANRIAAALGLAARR